MNELTEPQRRALRALVDLSGTPKDWRDVSPRQLALVLWPDSPAWKQRTRRHDGGNGAMGGTMPMKAAALLWKLKDLGLARRLSDHGGRGWTVTDLGRETAAGMGEQLPIGDPS